jgi:hypothetical protein
MAGARSELSAWLVEEWENPDRRRTNWCLLRAVSLFAGSIILMRNFGDQLA